MTSGGPDGTSRAGAVLIRAVPLFPGLDRRGHASVAFKGFEVPLRKTAHAEGLNFQNRPLPKDANAADHKTFASASIRRRFSSGKPDADSHVARKAVAVHRAHDDAEMEQLFVDRAAVAHLGQDEIRLARHDTQS